MNVDKAHLGPRWAGLHACSIINRTLKSITMQCILIYWNLKAATTQLYPDLNFIMSVYYMFSFIYKWHVKYCIIWGVIKRAETTAIYLHVGKISIVYGFPQVLFHTIPNEWSSYFLKMYHGRELGYSLCWQYLPLPLLTVENKTTSFNQLIK